MKIHFYIKRIFLGLIPLFASYYFLLAQNSQPKIDSLLSSLKNTRKQASKIKLLNELATLLIDVKPDSSIILAEQAACLSEKNGDKKSIASSYHNIGDGYGSKHDYTKALEYFLKELDIVKQIGTDSEIARCNKNVGSIYRSWLKEKQAIEFFINEINILNQLLEQAKRKGHDSEVYNYKLEIATTLNLMGNTSWECGNFTNAINYHLQSLKIYEGLDYKKGIASTMGNIGIVYDELGNYDKAIENHLMSIKTREEYLAESKNKMSSEELNKNIERQAVSYNNIGIVYQKKGDLFLQKSDSGNAKKEYDKALDYLFKSLKIYEEQKINGGVQMVYSNIGSVYSQQGDNVKALVFLLKSLKIAEDELKWNKENKTCAGCQMIYANLLFSISDHYLKQKKYNDALNYGKKALTISKEINSKKNLKNGYEILSNIYSALNNYKTAFEYHQLYSQYNDSLLNEESTKQVAEMQTKYETEKKEKEIEILNKDKEISTAQSKKQKIIIFSVAGGLFLVIVFAGLIFRSLRITKKQKNLIELQKAKVEEQKDEISKQKEIVEEQKAVVEKQKHLVEEHQKEIIDSITYAKRLQVAILPPIELIKKHLPESFLLYKPKDIVAGDFYWMEFFDNTVFIAAADCTGHGVPGAMVSVVCSNALNRTVKEFGLRDTGKILDKVTDLVLETFEKSSSEVKDGMDISLLSYNKTSKQIQWSGANNSLCYFVGNDFKEIKADKQPIGKYDTRKPFTTHNIEHSDNSVFYLFTDGLPDQFGGPKGKKYLYKRFENNLSDICKLPMDEQQTILEKAFQDWKGTLEQVDDVTVIGIKI